MGMGDRQDLFLFIIMDDWRIEKTSEDAVLPPPVEIPHETEAVSSRVWENV